MRTPIVQAGLGSTDARALSYGDAPWPTFDAEDVEAVTRVLLSGRVNYWTGVQGRKFEDEFASRVGVDHAVWLANGTVALESALLALRLPQGSEVVTTPRSFFATVTSIVNCGLIPVFADVDLATGNITPESVREVISPRTSAIVVVHLGGWPADMPAFRSLADELGLALVEDCAQGHGANVGGRSVGSFGDVNAWSFCQDKIMTTGGEGGMVTTNRQDLRDRAWSHKDHGKSWAAVERKDHPPGFRWLHESFGTNWRGTEMQAAIGLRQLAKLARWHDVRRRNAEALLNALSGIAGLRVPLPEAGLEHAYYRAYAYLRPENLRPGWDQQRFVTAVNAAGAPCFTGSCSEMYREAAMGTLPDFIAPDLPNARELGQTSLAFLVHPGLSGDDMSFVARAVQSVANDALDAGGEEPG